MELEDTPKENKARKSAKRNYKKSKPILNFSEISEQEINLPKSSFEALDHAIKRHNSYNRHSQITLEQLIANKALELIGNPLKFKPKNDEPEKRKITMVKAAWDVLESTAKENCATVEQVINEIIH